MLTWAAVYVAIGESKPTIWLLPTLVLVAALVLVFHITAPRSAVSAVTAT
jgi:hypothetical protein